MCRTFIHGAIFHPASSLFPLPCPDEVGTAVGRDTGGATLGPRNLHQGVEVHRKVGVFQLGKGCLFKGLYYENIIGLKGILQRDVRGVESRIKRSILINCLVALVSFFKLMGHSCERSKKTVSAS
jgi:hypothetical protein